LTLSERNRQEIKNQVKTISAKRLRFDLIGNMDENQTIHVRVL